MSIFFSTICGTFLHSGFVQSRAAEISWFFAPPRRKQGMREHARDAVMPDVSRISALIERLDGGLLSAG